jgi:hypothetical protein
LGDFERVRAMTLSGLVTILTALIGLIGVYIAFALIVSWMLEQIASVAQLRSKALTLALRQFLGGQANDFSRCRCCARDFVSGLLIYVSQSALARRLQRAQAVLAAVQKLPPDVKKLLPDAVAAADSAEALAAGAKADLAALGSAHVEGDLAAVVETLKELGRSGSVLDTGDAASAGLDVHDRRAGSGSAVLVRLARYDRQRPERRFRPASVRAAEPITLKYTRRTGAAA